MYTLWGVFEDCLASFGGNVFSNTSWQCRNERGSMEGNKRVSIIDVAKKAGVS